MNEHDYINFLTAAQKLYRCTEAERAQRNHSGLAIRPFFELELHWFATGTS